MANFNLDGLMGRNRDYSRGYTFYFYLTNPAGGNSGEDAYLVKSASLPASVIDIATANWQGNAYKVGTTHTYSDWTVTFMCDPTDDIRTRVLKWSEMVHDPLSNNHGQPEQYMADQQIVHIDHYTGSPIAAYSLIKAWPSSVGEVSLDYGSKELASFSVTFAYQYFDLDKQGVAR